MALRLLAIIGLVGILCGCDTGLRQMGPTEHGVLFRKLPPQLGGGVSSKVKGPGQMAIVWPWDSIYQLDTSVQDISWGFNVPNDQDARPVATEQGYTFKRENSIADMGYVNTRALDGNEVALAVVVRYKVSTVPEQLVRLVEEVATSNDEVRDMVVAIARADIRTFMNELRTSEFLDKDELYKAVDKVRDSMSQRLSPYGIEVISVNLRDFRFERVLGDGSVDASYGERLKEIQKLQQDTEREKSRVETVKAKKQQEFNETQGTVNRRIAEADGAKAQAKLRGDAYYQTRANEAKGLLARGEAEVKGLIEKINALNGPGGQAILKLEIAKQLLTTDPRFIVLGQSGATHGVDVTRFDANQLINQIGLLEGLGAAGGAARSAPEPVTAKEGMNERKK